MEHAITLCRIGEAADPGARRILVDRLWPRGVSRERADWHEWLKDVAPTTELRKWYSHDPERWEEFSQRYREELADAAHAPALERLRHLASEGPLALLTSRHSIGQSHLTVLQSVLREAPL
jgi:uncharacterized protein YeaO (DUF488 family)